MILTSFYIDVVKLCTVFLLEPMCPRPISREHFYCLPCHMFPISETGKKILTFKPVPRFRLIRADASVLLSVLHKTVMASFILLFFSLAYFISKDSRVISIKYY